MDNSRKTQTLKDYGSLPQGSLLTRADDRLRWTPSRLGRQLGNAQGTNFVGAEREIKAVREEVDNNERAKRETS